MGLVPKFSRRPSNLPKKLMLVGHGKTCDTYMSPSGKLFQYRGHTINQFNSKNFWREVPTGNSKARLARSKEWKSLPKHEVQA